MLTWKNKKHIFNVEHHNLPKDCISHAQSPQAIELEDRIRIFFSSRSIDKNKKFLSHILYVDYSKDFSKIIDISKKSCLELGEVGSYYEHGIFPIHIFKDENNIFGFITGWSRRASVSAESAIGVFKSSDDGKNFKQIFNGPIMSAIKNEPFLVADPFILKIKDEYNMFYIFGDKWIKKRDELEAERVYKIARATSHNLFDWDRDSKFIIESKLTDECQALPSVIKIKDKFVMVFCYRDVFNFRKSIKHSYKLGYAYSKDLKNWIRDDSFIKFSNNSEWDNKMQCYPQFFKFQEKFFLLYNGNNFGEKGFGIAELEGLNE